MDLITQHNIHDGEIYDKYAAVLNNKCARQIRGQYLSWLPGKATAITIVGRFLICFRLEILLHSLSGRNTRSCNKPCTFHNGAYPAFGRKSCKCCVRNPLGQSIIGSRRNTPTARHTRNTTTRCGQGRTIESIRKGLDMVHISGASCVRQPRDSASHRFPPRNFRHVQTGS